MSRLTDPETNAPIHTHDSLCIHAGISGPELDRMLRAYENMVTHYLPLVPKGKDKSPGAHESKFSFFLEFERNAVKTFTAKNNIDVKTYSKWIHEGRLTNARALNSFQPSTASPLF